MDLVVDFLHEIVDGLVDGIDFFEIDVLDGVNFDAGGTQWEETFLACTKVCYGLGGVKSAVDTWERGSPRFRRQLGTIVALHLTVIIIRFNYLKRENTKSN